MLESRKSVRAALAGVGLAGLIALSACAPVAPVADTANNSQTGAGQTAPVQQVANMYQPSGVTVSGQGIVKAKPDLAVISVGVQNQATTAQEAQATNNQQMTAVIDKIKSLGIEDKDIVTSGISLWPVRSNDGMTITGYEAMNMVTVTVNKIDQTGTVLDAAVQAGANTASNVTFGLKDYGPLRQQALQLAVSEARTKADSLVGPLGLKITSVMAISEGYTTGQPMPMDMSYAAGKGMDAAQAAPIQPGELSVQAQVTVVFAFGQ